MAPKKQATTMSLNDFLADQTKGSWADEMEDLPSAPSATSTLGRYERPSYDDHSGSYSRDASYGSRDRYSSGPRLGDRPDRESQQREYQPRRDVPLPTEPPFTAHLGNLPFELTDNDVELFFTESKVKSVRILRDRDERAKGFGYVEFEDLVSLTNALKLTGETLGGRNIRVNVAEPPKDKNDRTDGMWRREGPPPSLREPPANERSERYGSGRGNDKGGFRDRGFGNEGPRERTFHSRPSDTDWRGGAFSNNRKEYKEGSFDKNTTPPSPTSPVQRKKLELKPRSITNTPSADSTPATTPTSRSNPFGAAKPIDTDAALRRVEERRATKPEEVTKVLSKSPRSPKSPEIYKKSSPEENVEPKDEITTQGINQVIANADVVDVVRVPGVMAKTESKPTPMSNGFSALSIDEEA